MTTNSASDTSNRELSITRIFDTDIDTLFEVWTNPEHIANWWGPNGFTNTVSEMEVRPGGVWRYVMHGPDGTDYQNLVTYLEVVKPERLVYLHGVDDNDREHFQVTVIFEALGDQTRLSMTLFFKSPEERARIIEASGASDGLRQNMDRLAAWISRLD